MPRRQWKRRLLFTEYASFFLGLLQTLPGAIRAIRETAESETLGEEAVVSTLNRFRAEYETLGKNRPEAPKIGDMDSGSGG